MSEYNLYQVIYSYSYLLEQKYSNKEMDIEKFFRMNNKVKQWIYYLHESTKG
jgi:hypothetical protein